MIHIYCGDGKGKTTASIGLAVRCGGYGKKVLFMQFLKGSYTGELEVLGKCENIKVMHSDKENIVKCHNENLQYALDNMNEFDMIVLDEIFASYNYDLVDKASVRNIVENYGGELVMTGRNPDEWFCEKADYISEIKKIKHPYDKGIVAREGIEY